MCGILAYHNKNKISKKNLLDSIASLNAIKHRGPDGDGIILINSEKGEFTYLKTEDCPINEKIETTIDNFKENYYDILLGHRRLSIFDITSAGFQPMVDEVTNNIIVFNGEIYNFVEIKNELKSKGYNFYSNSDTEVILKAYEQYGIKCFELFNGMWSIVLFDSQQKKLIVSNDRFGVKPLYFYSDKKECVLASEIKQILAYSKNSNSLNKETIDVFLRKGYLDFNNQTFFDKVFRFQKASFREINLSKNELENELVEPQTFYKINIQSKKIKKQDAFEEFRFLLKDAVKLRLRADVNFAFALSGGLDSSAIVYLANQLLKEGGYKEQLNSFSAIFPGMKGDESYFMDIIKNDLNLRTNYIEPLKEFSIEDFEKQISQLEFPPQSTAFYASWSIYRAMQQEKIKILLVGQGADEVFAGYHHHFYKYISQLGKKLQFKTLTNETKSFSELKDIDKKLVYSYVKNQYKRTLQSNKSNHLDFDKWSKTLKLEEMLLLDFNQLMLPTYLRLDDRNAMAFGIESRHPFMDYRLVDFGFSLPNNLKIQNGWQKYILRESLYELPHEIRYRKDKKGFTTPQELWIEKYQNEFQSYENRVKDSNLELSNDSFRNYALGCWLKVFN